MENMGRVRSWDQAKGKLVMLKTGIANDFEWTNKSHL